MVFLLKQCAGINIYLKNLATYLIIGLDLKAHEIAVRFKFGAKPDTPELEEPSVD
tara:strand:+ start:776 stop:940 length:165 start_codon:yes stop_codon:yes gene_type:complete